MERHARLFRPCPSPPGVTAAVGGPAGGCAAREADRKGRVLESALRGVALAAGPVAAHPRGTAHRGAVPERARIPLVAARGQKEAAVGHPLRWPPRLRLRWPRGLCIYPTVAPRALIQSGGVRPQWLHLDRVAVCVRHPRAHAVVCELPPGRLERACEVDDHHGRREAHQHALVQARVGRVVRAKASAPPHPHPRPRSETRRRRSGIERSGICAAGSRLSRLFRLAIALCRVGLRQRHG